MLQGIGAAFLAPSTLALLSANFPEGHERTRAVAYYGDVGGIGASFWLSRLSADTYYLTGIALPMIIIGIGQGASLGPLTAAGIAGVASKDAGAASGLVNVALFYNSIKM